MSIYDNGARKIGKQKIIVDHRMSTDHEAFEAERILTDRIIG